MKQQIIKFSPHQNGKVFGVLTALMALVFLLPFMLIYSALEPAKMQPAMLTVLIMPLLYLVIGYIGVGICCMLYNWFARFTGCIEFEARDPSV